MCSNEVYSHCFERSEIAKRAAKWTKRETKVKNHVTTASRPTGAFVSGAQIFEAIASELVPKTLSRYFFVFFGVDDSFVEMNAARPIPLLELGRRDLRVARSIL